MGEPKLKEQYQPKEEELRAIEESKILHNEGVQQTKKEMLEKQLVEEGKAYYTIDEDGKETINLTDEQIEDITNQEKSKEHIFNNKQNQNSFEQLDGATKNTISNIYKNIKSGFIDRYKASGNNKFYSRHKEMVATLEGDIATKKRAVKQAEADIKTHDLRMQKMSDQFGGLTQEANEKALKEKSRLEKKLRDANYEETELIAKQVSSKKKLKEYEEKRNKTIEGIKSFVNEKTEPYKEKINELKENTKELDEQIEDFVSKRNVFENQLNELKEQFTNLKNSKTGIYESEIEMYTTKIKEVDTEYRNIDKIIKSVEKDKGKINIKIKK